MDVDKLIKCPFKNKNYKAYIRYKLVSTTFYVLILKNVRSKLLQIMKSCIFCYEAKWWITFWYSSHRSYCNDLRTVAGKKL